MGAKAEGIWVVEDFASMILLIIESLKAFDKAKMGKLGKKARKFAKKNLQSVMRKKRKIKSMVKLNGKDIVEGNDMSAFEQHTDGKSGGTTIGLPPSNALDNMIYESDSDLVDASESESFLSEDPDCPYISDSDIGSNCTGESNYAALTENNKKIHMEVLQQKRKLEMLIGKDPDFSEYLSSQKAQCMELRSKEVLSDEEGDDIPML
ncbi:hypothetical protein HPP92_011862 [Vanilla planifolia]|uniref:Uncharacterized protein n=1 Tax=Vanilla planifolia TaxID=51239 RepID=A0A835R4Z3_VANPL|nr:hypothetical protein HPP92_011862 [Vanilla planifolia]